MSFYRAHRRGIWLATVLFGIAYLAIHFLVFDEDFVYRGLWEFLKEGRAHLIHVAPVVIAFVVLLIKDRLSR